MGAPRRFVSQFVRQLYARHDVQMGAQGAFGINAFADVQRLATRWNMAIRTVLDVGANDGDAACEIFSHWPQASVLSFEPHPATFQSLNKRLGTHSGFQSYNMALGDSSGELEMMEYENSKINSLLASAPFAARFQEQGKTIRIQSTTLDSFSVLNKVATIDLLKIDTEGFELQVLQGSRSMLQSGCIRFLYLEFNDLVSDDERAAGSLLPLAQFLRGYRYRFVASYNDYISTDGEMFAVSNALFALPPNSGSVH